MCDCDGLETVENDDLADELERRGGLVIWAPDMTSVLDWLSDYGVPPEVLEPLERWASEPVVDRRRLDAWLLACRASTGAEAADAQA